MKEFEDISSILIWYVDSLSKLFRNRLTYQAVFLYCKCTGLFLIGFKHFLRTFQIDPAVLNSFYAKGLLIICLFSFMRQKEPVLSSQKKLFLFS